MKNKKNLMFIGIATITLIVVVLGATYAYFVAQGGSSANTNVDVQTNTTDNLSFEVGNPITLNINQDNFYQGAGNQAGSTTASATLTANNATNNATANYYLYLDITSNNFEYTVDTDIPELILTITAPNGTELQTLSGYQYVEIGEVSGFDITTISDVIKIAENYEITSTGTETQTWNITVTFVNLDSDQVDNTGKSFVASLIIQSEPLQTSVNFASYITDTLYTEDGIKNLYYHDGQGDYINSDQEAGDNSYRFSGGDYQVTSAATEAGLTRVYTASSTESDGVINFYCNGSKSHVGASCPVEQEHYYTTAYNERTQYQTLEEALSQAITDGYLTPDNIKNFVCFGPGASSGSCSEDNLYRIIGVFDGQVKLIKYDYADTTILGENGAYVQSTTDTFWSGNTINASSYHSYTSDLELLNINLNNNYWNYLKSEWQNKIFKNTWKTGGNTISNIQTSSVKTVFYNEIINPAELTSYEDEIGLIYVSDYMYATNPNGWTEPGYNNSNGIGYAKVKGENWLYHGLSEWTISSVTTAGYNSFSVHYGGNINYYSGNGFSVRPVFYLNTDVEIIEGHAGTVSDPYRIVI